MIERERLSTEKNEDFLSKNRRLLTESLARAGYECNYIELEAGNKKAHFTRLISEKFYPHFHLIIDSQANFNLHIDTRHHRSIPTNQLIGQECERLHAKFNQFSQETPNLNQGRILAKIAKKWMELALFNTTNWLNQNENHRAIQITNLLKSGSERPKITARRLAFSFDGHEPTAQCQ